MTTRQLRNRTWLLITRPNISTLNNELHKIVLFWEYFRISYVANHELHRKMIVKQFLLNNSYFFCTAYKFSNGNNISLTLFEINMPLYLHQFGRIRQHIFFTSPSESNLPECPDPPSWWPSLSRAYLLRNIQQLSWEIKQICWGTSYNAASGSLFRI